MLYLPRLFVYHCETQKGSIQSETFKIMERRLLKAIINPAMILAWVLGLYPGLAGRLVHLRLAARQGAAGADPLRHPRLPVEDREGFRRRRNTRPARFYRMINEVPTVLMIGIVILVIVKPF